MMTVDLIRTLYDYNYWANDLVWEAANAHINDHDFYKNTEYSWGSIHAQFVHNMNNEWMWFNRLRGYAPEYMLSPERYKTREAINAKWREVEAEVRGYINALDDDQLKQDFVYATPSGMQHRQSIGEVLLHVINSGTDSRAQIIAMMHILGAPTVEQGLIYYMQERNETA